VAHLSITDNGLILVDDPLAVRPGDIRPGKDGMNPGERPGCGRLHPTDQAVGYPRPADPRPKEILAIVIHGVMLRPGDLGQSVGPDKVFPYFRRIRFHNEYPFVSWKYTAFSPAMDI